MDESADLDQMYAPGVKGRSRHKRERRSREEGGEETERRAEGRTGVGGGSLSPQPQSILIGGQGGANRQTGRHACPWTVVRVAGGRGLAGTGWGTIGRFTPRGMVWKQAATPKRKFGVGCVYCIIHYDYQFPFARPPSRHMSPCLQRLQSHKARSDIANWALY